VSSSQGERQHASLGKRSGEFSDQIQDLRYGHECHCSISLRFYSKRPIEQVLVAGKPAPDPLSQIHTSVFTGCGITKYTLKGILPLVTSRLNEQLGHRLMSDHEGDKTMKLIAVVKMFLLLSLLGGSALILRTRPAE